MTITLKATRAEAKSVGDKHYFTGQPCKRGHIAKRVVSTSNCCECMREDHFKYYPQHREQYLQVIKQWQQANKETVNERTRTWRKTQPESARRTHEKYYAANREQKLAFNRAWRKLNKAVVQQYGAKRRAMIKQAMPVWANVDDIIAVYKQSVLRTQETGIPHHVDHIVPLGGDTVCGLHVAWNLQVLEGAENMRKGNRFSDIT